MRLGRLTAVAAVVLTALLLAPAWPATAADDVLLREAFTGGDTTPGAWYSASGGGNTVPCLTAATAKPAGGIPACVGGATDQPGKGSLQLTSNGPNDPGFAYYTRPLRADQGASIEFDMFQFNAVPYEGRGGDGISFFLLDGKAAPAKAGKPGAGLGYVGLEGALIGVGFDEFGNFSNTAYNKGGLASKATPNTVGVRGAQATGYNWVGGKAAPKPLAVDTAKTRDTARRHVKVDISTSNVLTVELDGANVVGPLDLAKIPGQPALPETFKFGFAGSTGAATAFHQIQGLTIQTLKPNLQVKVTNTGEFRAGGTASVDVTVSNTAASGPTTAPVTVTVPVPDSMTVTSATGQGWTCKVEPKQATCTRPGTDADTLAPGKSYPVITVGTTIAEDAGGDATIKVTSTTPDESDASDNTFDDKVTIQAVAKPDLSTTVKPLGAVTSPGSGTFEMTVSNAAGAGSTTQLVTATVTVPDGQTVVSAKGEGWSCRTDKQQVTCTRPGSGTDALEGGESYPAVDVIVDVPAGSKSPVVLNATVATPNDKDPANNAAKPAEVPVKLVGPDLSATVRPDDGFTSPGTGTYELVVSNADGAGPTTSTVTQTFEVPAGQAVTSVSGVGWDCEATGQKVICSRPGTGPDALQGGGAFPPVAVSVKVPAGVKSTPSVTTTVTTRGDVNGKNDTSPSVEVPVKVLGPDLSTTVRPDGGFTSPGKGAYELTVSNAAAAGPTTGTVTQTFDAPAGQVVTSAGGDGWNCVVDARKVTCTREDPLAPGARYPAVTVSVDVPAGVTEPASVTATVTTPGDTDTKNDTSPTVPVPVRVLGPDLLPVLRSGEVRDHAVTLQVEVQNAQDAGPTTGPVTVTFPIPPNLLVEKVAGTGWTCKTDTRKATVTCTRSGDGTDTLAGGRSYPMVELTARLCHKVRCVVDLTATVRTKGDSDTTNDTNAPLKVRNTVESALAMTITRSPEAAAGRGPTWVVTVLEGGRPVAGYRSG